MFVQNVFLFFLLLSLGHLGYLAAGSILCSDFVLPLSLLSSFQWFQQVITGEGTCSETQKQRGHSGEGEAQ